MLAPARLFPEPQIGIAQAPPALSSFGEQHFPAICLFGAAQAVILQAPDADADCPAGQHPPSTPLGDDPAGQQTPSLLACATAQDSFGGVFLHSPVAGSGDNPGKQDDTVFLHAPVAGSGLEPGGHELPLPGGAGGHSPVFGSGCTPFGQTLKTISLLHCPVFGLTVEPTGQHWPVPVTAEPGAQHCLDGQAVPLRQST